MCVCAQRGERLLCGRSVHHLCSCVFELLTVLDRTLVVWYTLPYSALLTVSLCDTCETVSTVMWVTVGGATWEHWG